MKKSLNKKKEKESNIIIGTMVGIIVLIVVITLIIHSSNNFKYLGMDFKRVREGNLILFTTDFNVFIPGKGNAVGGIYLRNDPRALKDIPVNGLIKISTINSTFVSTDPNIEGCEDNMLALVNMGIFLKTVGANAKSASNDRAFAEKYNVTYATCENAGDNQVIIIKKDGENSIKQTAENCYEIYFNDCEILKSTERFIVGTLANALGYTEI